MDIDQAYPSPQCMHGRDVVFRLSTCVSFNQKSTVKIPVGQLCCESGNNHETYKVNCANTLPVTNAIVGRRF